MKNVNRVSEPSILRENSKKWTDDLLAAIDNYKKNGVIIPPKVKNRYKKKDVLDALKRMYSDGYGTCFCCYCESPIEDVGYPHIEHRKPKDKDLFPKETFNWRNLHLACEKCNKNKGIQWDISNQILDAVKDKPIEKHLGYKVTYPEGVYVETITQRGVTTEKHTDLNREPLRIARLKILNSIKESVDIIKASSNEPRAYTAKQMLFDKCSGIHGSLIAWALKI